MSMGNETPVRRRGNRVCDRCGFPFVEGYRWPGLGIPIVLCKECTEDVEESAASFGEDGEQARRRLLHKLRGVGM
jgi:hypothetical protein